MSELTEQQRDDRRQELRRLARMLQNIVKTARDTALTGQLAGGKTVAIRQYHAILARLTALGVVDSDLFPLLEESASFDEVGFAASQLLSFFQDEDEEQDRKRWRNGGGVFEASPDHVKIVGFPGGIGELGDLLREHLPDFLRAKMGKVKEEAQKVGEQVREEVNKVREGVREEAAKAREEAQKARDSAREEAQVRDQDESLEADEPEIHFDFRGAESLRSRMAPEAPAAPAAPQEPEASVPPSPPEPPAPPVFTPSPAVTIAAAPATEHVVVADLSSEIAALAEQMRQPGISPEELGHLAEEMGRLARRQAEGASNSAPYRYN